MKLFQIIREPADVKCSVSTDDIGRVVGLIADRASSGLHMENPIPRDVALMNILYPRDDEGRFVGLNSHYWARRFDDEFDDVVDREIYNSIYEYHRVSRCRNRRARPLTDMVTWVQTQSLNWDWDELHQLSAELALEARDLGDLIQEWG